MNTSASCAVNQATDTFVTFFLSLRATLMGGLGVWAVALALLGTSGCWLAEGHKTGSAGTAGASTQIPRSTVNV